MSRETNSDNYLYSGQMSNFDKYCHCVLWNLASGDLDLLVITDFAE